MPVQPKSPLNAYKSNNDLIKESQDATTGDAYFYSLCRPRPDRQKRECLDCHRTFTSNNLGNRVCSTCNWRRSVAR